MLARVKDGEWEEVEWTWAGWGILVVLEVFCNLIALVSISCLWYYTTILQNVTTGGNGKKYFYYIYYTIPLSIIS